MAAVTYINNDYETLAEAMQRLVAMGYFSAIGYDSDTAAVTCWDEDGNAVLTLTKNSTTGCNVTLRLDSGTTQTFSIGTSASAGAKATLYYLYVCSGGAYISTVSNAYLGLIISKTNNGKIGVIGLGADGGSSTAAATRAANVASLAADDAETEVGTKFTYGVPTLRNQTVLTDVPTCAAPTVPSYFSDVRYTLTSQFNYTSNTATPPQNFTQNGKRYLWVGYFAIRDEAASA